jgi:hypothetical protein
MGTPAAAMPVVVGAGAAAALVPGRRSWSKKMVERKRRSALRGAIMIYELELIDESVVCVFMRWPSHSR